jgi:PD-(D/E)XK nuclease superfamily
MRWSVSSSKTFSQCPKKWYYDSVFASKLAKSPLRHEAYLLKHLQSIRTWRGKLVDQVISTFVVPALNLREQVSLEQTLSYANDLSRKQLTFARDGTFRKNTDSKPTSLEYCALFELDYEGQIDSRLLEEANDEVYESLTNFMNSRLISELRDDTSWLISQRPLQFPFANVNVRCTPDLIAFFKNKPPAIIDWKVQTPKHKEHWIQLAVYAYGLSRITPHKDFPVEWQSAIRDPTNIRLVEFQLLRNQELNYSICEDDIVDVEDFIYSSANRMRHVVNGHSDPSLIIKNLPTTYSPDVCMRCKFRKICWEAHAS